MNDGGNKQRARRIRQSDDSDDLIGLPGLRRFLDTQFPSIAHLTQAPDRRSFLRLMAASLALAGMAGCDDSDDGREQEVPYVRSPERMQPGAIMRFASAALLDGFANGVTVNTTNGRPIKIEGNPAHPWSRGGTDVFAQASVLGLYDPWRSQSVRYLDRISDWNTFRGVATGHFAALRATGGAGLRLLTGPVTSPTTLAQIAAMRQAYPHMRWHSYAPSDRTDLYAGSVCAFGRPLETRWRFDRAEVIVALDGGFLDHGPHQVGASRDWIEARRASARAGALLEMHAVAPTPTLTSAKAEFHAPAGPAEIATLADALLADLTGQSGAADTAGPLGQWRTRAAAALQNARGRSIVLAGIGQPAATHCVVHRINALLGNIGQTVFFTAAVQAQSDSLAALAAAMDRGEVTTLVMLDANPAYDAPGDIRFSDLLARVPLKIHAGIYDDETAAHADWHLPLSHPLESWGDARSFDGTVALMQPTIAPLYAGRTAAELLSLLADPTSPRTAEALLRAQWRGDRDAARFAPYWRDALLHGFLPDTALPEEAVQLQVQSAVAPQAHAPGLNVVFRTDPTVWDGAFANLTWLQELPKPLTKVTWENVIMLPPGLAAREHMATGDIVQVASNGRHIEGPAWIMPGQAEDTIAVTLGYGRTAADLLVAGAGYDAYALRQADSPWHLAGAALRRGSGHVTLATTQHLATMEGHDFVRMQTLGGRPVGDNTAFTQPRLYGPSGKYSDGRSWGMVIDLDACIGCNACVTACQAENNIPVVGRDQVRAGRIMQWLRIDRYYDGPSDNPGTSFLPVPCMHCEDAPCEVGCPVEATLHDHEGLNLQVYNRCIGTRACSSNCPYKVRRFNWFDYTGGEAPSVQQQHNPDVTVRSRGVMEKCTYCVQRIAEARIVSAKTNTPIPDNAVQTACQTACPTRAITFGDLAQPHSAVAAARHDPRNYALLGELNTRPHTTYLARLAPAKAPTSQTG